MKKKILSLLLLICLLLLSGCDENPKKIVEIKYNISSIFYDCDSDLETLYPVQFKLPSGHKAVELTLQTTNAYVFLGSITDLIATAPFTNLPTGGMTSLAGMASETGLDVVVTGLTLMEGVYSGDFLNGLFSAIAGRKLSSYIVKIVRYDGSVQRLTIPIGTTTLGLSKDVDFIEVRSTVSVEQTQYQKPGRVRGTVAYENAHEVEAAQYNLAPQIEDYQPIATYAPLEPVILQPIAGSFLPGTTNFIFSSGSGGWAEELRLNTDGSFTGHYFDSEPNEQYPNGIEYVCDYNGRFSNIVQTGSFTYSLELETINYSDGREWDENGTHYIATAPYGMSGKNFTLYLPGPEFVG